MSLEQKANQVMTLCDKIIAKCQAITEKVSFATWKLQVDGDEVELSTAKKQKIIAYYQARKAELEALVASLPG